MPRLLFIKLLSSIISKDRLRHQLSFYGVPFALGSVMSHLDRTVIGAVTFPTCSSVFSPNIKQISLSQSSSVHSNPDNVLVLVTVSAFPICGLRHPMKLVPLATLVHMDIKAFPSRPNSWKMRVTWIELDNIYNDR
ncbi:hypothetical protein T03_15105 [Trichinella britovi]|uniref:Uncharacterized protein n=1 Tax=Trichinella britovi TaxID=45882 RepID=A0A0V1CW57_TRIBR|nr:hypothetical protein T03_15105 [Trichinella britovi]